MCDTPGNPGNLLEIGKVSWKLSDSVQLFVVNLTVPVSVRPIIISGIGISAVI